MPSGGVPNAKGVILAVFQDLLQAGDATVLVGDQYIAGAPVSNDELGEDFAACPVHASIADLLPYEGDLDLVEAPPLDDTGIVGGIEAIDLDPNGLAHVFEEGSHICLTPLGLFVAITPKLISLISAARVVPAGARAARR